MAERRHSVSRAPTLLVLLEVELVDVFFGEDQWLAQQDNVGCDQFDFAETAGLEGGPFFRRHLAVDLCVRHLNCQIALVYYVP